VSQLPMDFRFSQYVCVMCRITTDNSPEDASASPAPSPPLAQRTVSQHAYGKDSFRKTIMFTGFEGGPSWDLHDDD
jgi:hypothetical protein